VEVNSVPTDTFAVNQYEIHLSPEPDSLARIDCELNLGANEIEWAQIYFVPTGTAVPASTAKTFYVPAEMYSWYVDLLRNETKIKITRDATGVTLFATGSAGWGHVRPD